MRNWILSIFVILFLLNSQSCKDREQIDPEQLLPDSLIVMILTDGFILNSAFNQTFGDVKDSVGKAYSAQILEKYKVSEEVLQANLDFRLRSPLKMDSIYQQMLDRIDVLEGKLHVRDDENK